MPAKKRTGLVRPSAAPRRRRRVVVPGVNDNVRVIRSSAANQNPDRYTVSWLGDTLGERADEWPVASGEGSDEFKALVIMFGGRKALMRVHTGFHVASVLVPMVDLDCFEDGASVNITRMPEGWEIKQAKGEGATKFSIGSKTALATKMHEQCSDIFSKIKPSRHAMEIGSLGMVGSQTDKDLVAGTLPAAVTGHRFHPLVVVTQMQRGVKLYQDLSGNLIGGLEKSTDPVIKVYEVEGHPTKAIIGHPVPGCFSMILGYTSDCEHGESTIEGEVSGFTFASMRAAPTKKKVARRRRVVMTQEALEGEPEPEQPTPQQIADSVVERPDDSVIHQQWIWNNNGHHDKLYGAIVKSVRGGRYRRTFRWGARRSVRQGGGRESADYFNDLTSAINNAEAKLESKRREGYRDYSYANDCLEEDALRNGLTTR